jgi:hypothetical protein
VNVTRLGVLTTWCTCAPGTCPLEHLLPARKRPALDPRRLTDAEREKLADAFIGTYPELVATIEQILAARHGGEPLTD